MTYKIEEKLLPTHIGIIMDGNGRWAKKRGKNRKFGHREGSKVFKKIVEYAQKIEIKYLTFYCFSTENWKRPQDEVDALMKMFEEYLDEIISDKSKNDNIRIKFIGDRSGLSKSLSKKMLEIEEKTFENKRTTVALAINYSGRQEIVNSLKAIVEKISDGEMSKDDINESIIEKYLYTNDMPECDLVIRPSGEIRISNFLLWQSAYSELYFTDVLWPDFTFKDFDEALLNYSKRKRRFGGI